MRAGYLAIALCVSLWACGGDTDDDDATGGAAGTDAGTTGGASGATTGGAAGSSGGAAGSSGATSGGSAGVGATGGSAGLGGGSAGAGGVDCNPSTAVCTLPAPQCPPGQVPSVTSGCWGPCVPILDCTPEPDCSNCQSGFCAAYVAFTTEYRCVMPSLTCSALACSCLAQYFCVDPFDACAPGGQTADVSCECTTC